MLFLCLWHGVQSQSEHCWIVSKRATADATPNIVPGTGPAVESSQSIVTCSLERASLVTKFTIAAVHPAARSYVTAGNVLPGVLSVLTYRPGKDYISHNIYISFYNGKL